MNTGEMIHAASAIAGPMAAAVADEQGALSPAQIETIARAAIAVAKKIEDEARHAYSTR
jgi:hypothetical protein